MIESTIIEHLIKCKNIIIEYQDYWFNHRYNSTVKGLIDAEVFINGILLSMHYVDNQKLKYDYLLHSLKKYNIKMVIQSICFSPHFLIKHQVEDKEITLKKRNELQNNLIASLELLFVYFKPKYFLEMNNLLENHLEHAKSVDLKENIMGI